MEAAVQAAHGRSSSTFGIGDGCGAPSCKGRTARLHRYREGQRRHAVALSSGLSILIEWPAGPGYTQIEIYPPETTAVVAAAAMCAAEALDWATPAPRAP